MTATNAVTNATLSSRAMLVSLRLSAWLGQRVDKSATREVLSNNNANADAGKFAKKLLPDNALKGITAAHSAARQRHYTLTLPWNDNGERILSSDMFFAYTKLMADSKDEIETALRKFYDEYPEYVRHAPKRLGNMYRAEEFPTLDELKRKYDFSLSILPLPSKDDFRVSLGTATEDAIKRSIETEVTRRYAEAQRDVWSRLQKALEHFAAKMSDHDAIFRNSTVTNVIEIVELAPRLLVVPDPELTAACERIKDSLNGAAVDPDILRNDTTARQSAADAALAELDRIAASMAGAF